jgi:hypothetical protein
VIQGDWFGDPLGRVGLPWRQIAMLVFPWWSPPSLFADQLQAVQVLVLDLCHLQGSGRPPLPPCPVLKQIILRRPLYGGERTILQLVLCSLQDRRKFPALKLIRCYQFTLEEVFTRSDEWLNGITALGIEVDG